MSAVPSQFISGIGLFMGTVGIGSLYINILAYYGTKSKIIRVAKEYGKGQALDVLEKEEDLYKSPLGQMIGGMGKRFVARRYRSGHYDKFIGQSD